MNKQTLLALIVWAIDTDGLSLPFTKAWERFQRDALGMYKTFTDPDDELLYCQSWVGKDPIDLMVDYTLSFAKCHVESGIRDYGKYDTKILNYKKL